MLTHFEPRLPALSIPLPPLEGENLAPEALKFVSEVGSVESVIALFRSRNSAEKLPWYRFHYLKAHVRGGLPTGRYSIYYKCKSNKPKSDRIVGTLDGEDIAAAKVLIGNSCAHSFMSPIRWELYEDRDGEYPIEIGRYDAWSLLKGVSASDLERLRSLDLVPDIRGWDFDKMYLERVCPGCGENTSVNMFVFNIDSAQCARCGIRPFLSSHFVNSLVSTYNMLAKNTEIATNLLGKKMGAERLLSTVGYMAYLSAQMKNIHQEQCPNGTSPHELLKSLLGLGTKSHLSELLEHKRSMIEETKTNLPITTALDSSRLALEMVVENGGPFLPMHQHMAEMLLAFIKD